MMDALNEFLGRTTVDSSLERAFEEGRLERALADCGFTPAAAASLSQLEAADFSSYIQVLFTEVMRQETAANAPPHPWPTDGLPLEQIEKQKKSEAA